MAVAADGYIRIDTKINQAGAQSGLNTLIKSLKGFAVAAGIAFGVAAVINFGKASVKAATDLTNAMMGLQSIVEGQGRSFVKAQKFINDYTQDGLIPATQAITAYKNLALRGYADSQIQQVLVALKDSAAFGRQSSYTLGQAVESATEGLKNENSILVDNAGLTKNVAKMWAEYAKSIGTTANNLTKQQKIQAEVLGIMEETKFQTGDAAKIADSYSGQILRLGFNFNNLKIAVGNIIIVFAQKVLPVINTMVEGVTRLANAIAQVVTGLFGAKTTTTRTVDAVTESIDGLTDATTASGEAAKEAGNNLAAFDEINVLSNTSDAGSAASGVTTETVSTTEEAAAATDDMSAKVEKLKEKLSVLKEPLAKLKEAWANLGLAVNDFWENSGIQKVLTRFAEIVGNKILDILAGDITILSGVFNVLAGVFRVITGLLSGDLSKAAEGAKLIFKGLGQIIEGVFVIILGQKAVEAIKTFISSWKEKISAWWTNDVKPWFTLEKWNSLWNDVKMAFAGIWDKITPDWDISIADWWKNKVVPWFTLEKWLKLGKGMKDGIIQTFRNAIESVRTLINKLIAWLNEKMKFSWEPIKIAGKTIVPGGSVQLFHIDEIPRLAQGAVIPPNREFMAVLGDQKSGTNIEAPDGLIRKIMQEELSNLNLSPQITVVASGNSSQLIRYLKFEIDKEGNRRGVNLIKGVT